MAKKNKRKKMSKSKPIYRVRPNIIINRNFADSRVYYVSATGHGVDFEISAKITLGKVGWLAEYDHFGNSDVNFTKHHNKFSEAVIEFARYFSRSNKNISEKVMVRKACKAAVVAAKMQIARFTKEGGEPYLSELDEYRYEVGIGDNVMSIYSNFDQAIAHYEYILSQLGQNGE